MNRKRIRRKIKKMLGCNYNIVELGNAYDVKIVGYNRKDLLAICELSIETPVATWNFSVKEKEDEFLKGYKQPEGKALRYISIENLI